MFSIAKILLVGKFAGTQDSTFVDALGPRDSVKIKPISNTEYDFSHVGIPPRERGRKKNVKD